MTLTERLRDETCSLEDCHTDCMAADIFTKHFVDQRKWQHAITLIGVLTPELQQKLLKVTPFPFCKFPQNNIAAVARSERSNETAGFSLAPGHFDQGPLSRQSTANTPPRFACTAFVQYCPIHLLKGLISQNEVCEFCRNAFAPPAMVCRPRFVVPTSSTSMIASLRGRTTATSTTTRKPSTK